MVLPKRRAWIKSTRTKISPFGVVSPDVRNIQRPRGSIKAGASGKMGK